MKKKENIILLLTVLGILAIIGLSFSGSSYERNQNYKIHDAYLQGRLDQVVQDFCHREQEECESGGKLVGDQHIKEIKK